MKTYCSNCGYKVEYRANEKPNFCPKCGHSFGGKSTAKTVEPLEDEIDTEEDHESFAISEDFELEVDIEDKPRTANRLSDLAGTSQGGITPPNESKKGRGRPRKVKNEDVWKEFKDEAGGTPHREQNED
mgnify:CR=1 FL=1